MTVADKYRVKAPVVKVSIGTLEGNRVAWILRAGGLVPDGVARESLESLEDRGLIEKVTVEQEPEGEDASESDASEDEVLEDSDSDEVPVLPAKAGPGSSAEAWRNYAAALNVDVAADAGRDDVIAALEAAGKPTE